jgi:hypothetical protein
MIAQTAPGTAGSMTPQARRIAFLISVVIFILAGINGIFTWSGAHLFIKEPFYALLFAVAVQFSIAISLIALPFVRGLGKLVLLLVYSAALILSTLSAYTFIYNSGLPGSLANVKAVDTPLKAEIADRLSEIMLAEQQAIDAETERLAFLERQAEEEAQRGYRSGRGAGKGPEYYRKLEALQADEVRFAAVRRDYEQARAIYDEMNRTLASPGEEQREQLILLLSKLKAHLNTEQARSLATALAQGKLAVIQSPVEKAMSRIVDRDHLSIQLVVSVVWAAVFDLLALFLGIIRYYVLKPSRSLLNGLYEMISAFVTFVIRLGYIRKHARQRFNQELQQQSHGTPLNSAEMQSFATYVMAGSLFSAGEGQDAIEPLKKLIGHIEPLNLPDEPNAVGVTFDTLESRKDMKTLMAMLIQNDIFLSDVEHRAYRLNPGSEMAQKILVFIRMGLKDDQRQQDLAPLFHAAGG